MLPPGRAQEVERVLGEFCRRAPPRQVRSQLEYAVRIDRNAVTLVELRPAFRADIGRTETLVARFRYNGTRDEWQLFCRDRNLDWHPYPRVRPARRLASLFAEVRRDPTGIFWG